MASKKQKLMTFEERMAEAERLLGVLQSGGQTLSDSLASYEQGMKLIGELQRELESYERRIEQVNMETGAVEPFGGSDGQL